MSRNGFPSTEQILAMMGQRLMPDGVPPMMSKPLGAIEPTGS